MSFGMFLGNLANGFNSSVKAMEDMAEKTDQQDRRKYGKQQRDRDREVWDEEAADKAERKRIYGGDTSDAPKPPTQAESQLTPDTAEDPRATRTMELANKDAPTAETSMDPGVAKPVDTVPAKPGYGMQSPAPQPSVQAPGMGVQPQAGTSGTNGVNVPRAADVPQRRSQFASDKDEQYYNYLVKSGRGDKAQEFKTKSMANRQSNDAANFQGTMQDILRNPGGLNNPDNLAQARDAALNSGQLEQYAKFASAYDGIMWQQSGAAMDRLTEESKGMSPQQVANAAARIFNEDVGAGNVEDIKVDPTTGQISFTATNKITGQRVSKSFKSTDEMLSSLRSFYSSPENLAAIKKQNIEWAQWKRKQDYEQQGKERLEKIKGENRSVRGGNWVQTENGDWVQLPSDPKAGSKSSKSGGSGSQVNPSAYSILFDANEKTSNDLKLSPDDMVGASEYIDLITSNNPALKNSPSTVARIARDIQRGSMDADGNPVGSTYPSIDFKTGQLVRAFRDGSTGQTINLGAISGSAVSPESRQAVAEQIGAALEQEPMAPGMKQLWKAAAKGDAGAKQELITRRSYQREEEIRKMIDHTNKVRAQQGQTPLSYTPAEIRAQARDATDSITRTLQMMATYGYKGE